MREQVKLLKNHAHVATDLLKAGRCSVKHNATYLYLAFFVRFQSVDASN